MAAQRRSRGRLRRARLQARPRRLRHRLRLLLPTSSTCPPSFLKIDIEFIRELKRNPADRQLVEAIVSIARGLGKKTIAEGVEDADTLKMVRELGVDYAQGFEVGRPESATKLVRTVTVNEV